MATNSSPKPAPSQQQGAQQSGSQGQTGPQMQGETAPTSVQQGQPVFRDWASI
jgi:hypothetical protein